MAAAVFTKLFIPEFGTIYPVTNKGGQDLTIQQLDKMTAVGKVAVATCCMGILNLAARLDTIDKIVIVGLSDRVAHFCQVIEPIIRNSPTANRCYREINKALRTHQDQFFERHPFEAARHSIDMICEERFHDQELSWFSRTNERFRRIQNIFRSGHFTFIKGDLRLVSKTQEYKVALGSDKVGLFYPSNVPDYTDTLRRLRLFRHSLSEICEDQTIVVHSENGLVQQVFLRKDYKPVVGSSNYFS